MFNIKDILVVQGFRNDDLVRFAIKDATMPNGYNWNQNSYSIDRVIRELANQKNHLNYYISHARHSGGNFTKKNFSEIVEMVIDIDYGPYHNKPSEYDTKTEALAAAMKLPKPTMVIHTGGGLQVHYRFRSRLKLPEYQKRFEQVSQDLAYHIGADSCYATGHTFRLTFTKNHKAKAPVRDVEIEEVNKNVDYTLEELEQWCTDHGVKKYTKATPKTKNKRNRKMKRKKPIGEDRSAQLFRMMERMIQAKPDIKEKEVFNFLKTKPIYNHYSEKGKISKTLFKQDFRRIKTKITKCRIPNPPNKVVKLKYEDNDLKELMPTKEIFDEKVYQTNDRIKMSLSLMEQLYLAEGKSILNFPCASGKTSAAIILAARYAAQKNRMWIVTQKVKNVKEIAEHLRDMGANAIEWHGWNDECPTPWKEFMKKKAKKSCSECQEKCTASHKYLSKTPWDNEEYDILVTTHSHWQATVASEKFNSSVKFVIVDESPTFMEYYTLDKAAINSISDIFKYNKELVCDFRNEINFIRNMCRDRWCHEIPKLNSIRKSREINQCIYKMLHEGEISSEKFEQVRSFINFFNTEEIYAMLERSDGEYKLKFIRGVVDLRTSVPHMVLDGSALMSDVYWEGFNIYECDELKQAYSNTTIDIIGGNPSKSFLSDKKHFNDLQKVTIESIKKHHHVLVSKAPVVIFRNKELDNDEKLKENINQLHAQVEELGLVLVDMCRGEHIGSNRGRHAVLCAIAMGLFNPTSYYVLRTALSTHSDIPADRIWRYKFGKPTDKPKMKTNGGFADFEIQQTYCRSVVVDLYQTIMRGCVRVEPTAHYNVVCVLSGPEIIDILKRELPKATFNFELAEVITALYAGKSDTEIKNEFKIGRDRLENLKESLNIS